MYRLVEYINPAAMLTGLAAMITALVTYFKYREGRTATPVYKAAEANARIADKLNLLVEKHTKIQLASVVEFTNGGGIPAAGKPLYARCISSTDAQTLVVFGEKWLVENNLVVILSRMLLKGDTFFLSEELSEPTTQSWYASKNLKKTYAFLIGIEDGTRVVALMVNTNSIDLLPQETYFNIVAACREIKKIIDGGSFFKKKLLS